MLCIIAHSELVLAHLAANPFAHSPAIKRSSSRLLRNVPTTRLEFLPAPVLWCMHLVRLRERAQMTVRKFRLPLPDRIFYTSADWVVHDSLVPTYMRSTLEAICRDDSLGLIETQINLTDSGPAAKALRADPRYVLARVRTFALQPPASQLVLPFPAAQLAIGHILCL